VTLSGDAKTLATQPDQLEAAYLGEAVGAA
jgi:hypothetical protein